MIDIQRHKPEIVSGKSMFILVLTLLTAILTSPVVDAVDRIYWSDGGTKSIARAEIEGGNVENVISVGMPMSSAGIVLDLPSEKMYWINRQPSHSIMRSNLDGTETEVIITDVAHPKTGSLALDLIHSKMYWYNAVNENIVRANLDGFEMENLLTTTHSFSGPFGLALDPTGGKMYWGAGGATIMRANLDGTDPEDLITSEEAVGITLDLTAGKIYWTDFLAEKIRRANLDGTTVEDVLTLPAAADPWAIAMDPVNGKVYWSVWDVSLIKRANLDGTGIETFLIPDIGGFEFESIAIDGVNGLIYLSNDDAIGRVNLDGSNVQVLLESTPWFPQRLAINPVEGKMYWTESQEKKIQRAKLDGTAIEDSTTIEDLVVGLRAPEGIALHVPGGKMYWTDFRKIQRANLDGSDVEDVITSDSSTYRDIAVDSVTGKIYWLQKFPNMIKRANLDGTSVEEVVSTGTVALSSIALDTEEGFVYWTNAVKDKIQRANLDGTGVEDLVTTGLNTPDGMVIDRIGGKMYWLDRNALQRANLDGTGAQDVVVPGMFSPSAITVLRNNSPKAVDDEASANRDQSITIDVVANDTDADGTIIPTTVELIEPRAVASFDGVNDKVVWGKLGLNGTSVLSKFIRFRTTDTSGVLFDTQFGDGADGGLAIVNGALKLLCRFYNSGRPVITIVDDEIAADGNWHTAGFTYDGSILTPYFDGVVTGTPLSVPDDTIRHNYPSTCGGRVFSSSGYFFAGEQADFVVYDQALSAADVSNYHDGNVPTAGLVLWGKMDEKDYSEGLTDSSGHKHHGSSDGATPVIDPENELNGTVENNGDGTVTYTPNSGFTGVGRFEYTVKDNVGDRSNIATVTINVANPPVAEDDTAETTEVESITINVIANDRDSDGTIDPETVEIVPPRHVPSFDGVNDKITWGKLGLDGTPVLSKFIRFRTMDKSGVLFDTQFGDGADGGLAIVNGSLKLLCRFYNSGRPVITIVDDAIAADGNWHTAGFTYDGSILTPYFDGVVTGTPLSIPDDTFRHNYPSTCGGRVFSSSGYYFSGELSDFVVYNAPLTEADVSSYHDGDVPITGLVLWGKMDEDDYSEGLADSSGNDHNGSSNGATPVIDPDSRLNGTLVNKRDGTITYTANSGFIGEDRFEYTVADNDGARSNIARVTIQVFGEDRHPGPDIWYVDQSATGVADGTSWENAFTNPQDALVNAGEEDQIWIAAGTYTPDIGGGNTPGNRFAGFRLKSGVELYGGFNGTETNLDERDWESNRTILSGDLNGDDATIGNSENSYHVITAGILDLPAILDGFTITGGNANGKRELFDRGGGVLIDVSLAFDESGGRIDYEARCCGASVTIFHCTIINNTAEHGGGIYNGSFGKVIVTQCNFVNNNAGSGGGIYSSDFTENLTISQCNFMNNSAIGGGGICNSSELIMRDCTFNDNSATEGGGILDSRPFSSRIANCLLENNSAIRNGGGLWGIGENLILEHSRFINNAAGNGGGAAIANDCLTTISHCSFYGNTASMDGGGLHVNSGQSNVLNCVFSGNSAGRWGGGCWKREQFEFDSVSLCTFSRNFAGENGGGLWIADSIVSRCIFSENTAGISGGGISAFNSFVLVRPNVFWENTDSSSDEATQHIFVGPGIYLPVGLSMEDQVVGDPLFADADGEDNITGTEDDNLQLRQGSAAIDLRTGTFSPDDDIPLDILGNPRVNNGREDAGAYEFVQLVGYWAFNDATDSVATDLSGFNNDGTLVNDPELAFGRIGGALLYDGVDDYVQVEDDELYRFGADESFSITVWVRDDEPTGNTTWGPIVQKSDRRLTWVDAAVGYGISRHGSTRNKVIFAISDGVNNQRIATTPLADGFHFLALVVDREAQEMKAYADGVLLDTRDISGIGSIDTSRPLRMGFNDFRHFKGVIDEVKIYSRTLSAEEIIDAGIAPKVSAREDRTLECDASPSTITRHPTVTNFCGTTPPELTFSDKISGDCPRTITRTWTATDACGNVGSDTEIITLVPSLTHPIAEDDSVTTNVDQSITLDLVANDSDFDGEIVPSTVAIVRPRYVASFDGVDDKIIWGDLGLHGTPELSKFIRFRTTDKSAVLFDTNFGGTADGGLAIVNGALKLLCTFTISGRSVIDIVDDDIAADGNWHTAGFTYDGATLTPYFDGVVSGTPLSVPDDTIRHNYPSTCGGRVFSNSGFFFTGELIDFVVYDHALSAENVLDYHRGSVRQWFRLALWGIMNEEDYGSGLADFSRHDHTGTSAGAVPIFDPAEPLFPENGSIVNNDDGTVTYTPNSGFVGDDQFEYTVKDDDGNISNIATVIITVNSPPIAEDDMTETPQDQSITINVVANDRDEHGTIDPETVELVSPRYVASFDGVNDKITWGKLGLDGTSVLSKFIRFRTTDKSGVLFDTQFGDGADGGLAIVNGSLKLLCRFHNSGRPVITIVDDDIAADGNWHTAGFTYDGSMLTPYFDGVVTGTPLSVPDDTLRHNYPSTCGGRVFSSSGYYFAGELADFVVYDEALSEADVSRYHNGSIPTTGLVLWGKMDEEDYSEGLADSSGNGHAGTSTGAVPILDPETPMTPANGTVVNNGDGTITYTPNAEFIGEDQFDYTVKDDDGAVSNVATVTITVSATTSSAVISKFARKAPNQSANNSALNSSSPSELLQSIVSGTVYEDAEDGTINGWLAYGDGTVTNVEGVADNRIIATDGDVSGDPFRLGLADHSDWNNTKEFTASFAILMDQHAAVYFRVDTTEGEKYLCYQPGPETIEISDNVICFGLGIEADGEWHTISRDLAGDLTAALPSSHIIAVKDFYVFGNVKLDDIMLMDASQ